MTVRTRGSDNPGGPPICLVDWDSVRISENGANPLAAILRDDDGDATGREFHRYHRMTFDLTIRTDDEGDRDFLLSDVADNFLPYEYDAEAFHKDTTEWEVGDPTPRSNAVVEPDWYEGGLTIRLIYVSRVQRSADTLTGVQDGVYVDETLDE